MDWKSQSVKTSDCVQLEQACLYKAEHHFNLVNESQWIMKKIAAASTYCKLKDGKKYSASVSFCVLLLSLSTHQVDHNKQI